MNEENQIGGLILESPDPRNFPLGGFFDLPKVETLPSEFLLPAVKIKNQGGNDKCTAYASSSASEIQEGIDLLPDYTFAVAKALSGKPESWGLPISLILDAHVKVGAIEYKDAPIRILNDVDNKDYRWIEAWPKELIKKAAVNKKASYFQVTGPKDSFDNIKSAIYKFRDKKQAVIFGVKWCWPLSQIYMEEFSNSGFGHCMFFRGWTTENGKEYLVAQNSAGEEAGRNGYHLFSREVVNHFVDMYGAYMMLDMDRETVEDYLENNIKETDGTLAKVFKYILFSTAIQKAKELLLLMLQKKMNGTKRTLVEALIQVESGGDDHVIGDKHLVDAAYGCLQIRKPCVDDVNTYFKTKFRAAECLGDRALSIDIFNKYMSIYATEKRLGRPITDEDRARIWNGGPQGYAKASTVSYWNKVKKYL